GFEGIVAQSTGDHLETAVDAHLDHATAGVALADDLRQTLLHACHFFLDARQLPHQASQLSQLFEHPGYLRFGAQRPSPLWFSYRSKAATDAALQKRSVIDPKRRRTPHSKGGYASATISVSGAVTATAPKSGSMCMIWASSNSRVRLMSGKSS